MLTRPAFCPSNICTATRNIKMLTVAACATQPEHSGLNVALISAASVSSRHDKEHQNAYLLLLLHLEHKCAADLYGLCQQDQNAYCRCLIDREQHMHCDKEHQNAYFDPVSLQRLPGFSARATVSQMPLRSLEKCTPRDKPDSFCSASQRRSPALDTSCRVNDTRQRCHCTVSTTSSVSRLADCQ